MVELIRERVRILKIKNLKSVSKWLMYVSALGVLLSALGYLGIDIWLASTQWLLVAAVLALFGVYLKL